jgi:hypothetical protein
VKNAQKIIYAGGIVLAAGALLVAGTPAFAATNLISNGDFEAPVTISPTTSFGSLAAGDTWDGWDIHSHVEPLAAPKYPVFNGNQSLDMDGGSPAGEISQTFATVPGSQYLVSFEITSAGDVDRQVRADIDGTALVTGTWNPAIDTADTFVPASGTFTATAATSTLTLTSINTNNSVTPIDDVSVTLVDPADSPLVNPAIGGIAAGIAALAGAGVYLGRRYLTARAVRR